MKRIELCPVALTLLLMLLSGCSETPSRQDTAAMFPDYRDVTVPCNIAPLNFHYTGGGLFPLTVFECGEVRVRVRGRKVCLEPEQWRALVRQAIRPGPVGQDEKAEGGDIVVTESPMGQWRIHVSADSMDRYLTYRLIEPGYEVWDRVEICERDISTFNERAISSWKNTDNSCMNCHVHKGDNSIFYLRGDKGGAIFNRGGQLRKLSLRNPDMISGTVYGDISPDGRWGVFSTNIIIPGFHTEALRRLEVYDTASDLSIADFDGSRMLNPGILARGDRLETFPCFSADGRSIFYCSADTVCLPDSVTSLRYSLMKASFDPSGGEAATPQVGIQEVGIQEVGIQEAGAPRIGAPEVLWDGPAHGKSVCHPKASPDGRWLMFTLADYGTFPIWHRECDLALMDLRSGELVDIDCVNSDRSDTYHSWSSNSRWFVFASKRGDGQYGRPYICHIGPDGSCAKPFLLPQEDPFHYEKTLKSYNIPDLGAFPVPFDSEAVADIRANTPAEQFK